MLKMFVGMIIGSMMTMMLLGGASAADQVLANVQTLYLDPIFPTFGSYKYIYGSFSLVAIKTRYANGENY